VYTSAKTRLTSVAIRIRDPNRHRNLFCSLAIANLPWKFHANLFGSFYAKLVTGIQTNRQRNNDDYIILLGGGNENLIWSPSLWRPVCKQSGPILRDPSLAWGNVSKRTRIYKSPVPDTAYTLGLDIRRFMPWYRPFRLKVESRLDDRLDPRVYFEHRYSTAWCKRIGSHIVLLRFSVVDRVDYKHIYISRES